MRRQRGKDVRQREKTKRDERWEGEKEVRRKT